MHYYNGMLDSDLKESKDKRKLSYIQTKSRDCKHDLQKYSNIKNSGVFLKVQQYEELWCALEKERGNGTPIILYDLMKGSSFTSVKNSFEIMGAKLVPYFEGVKD